MPVWCSKQPGLPAGEEAEGAGALSGPLLTHVDKQGTPMLSVFAGRLGWKCSVVEF